MEVTEYFDTRPQADAYAVTLRGCKVRVGYSRSPVRGYQVVAVYHYEQWSSDAKSE